MLVQEDWARPRLLAVGCLFVLGAIGVSLHNLLPAGALTRAVLGVPHFTPQAPVVSVPFRGTQRPASLSGVAFTDCVNECYDVEYSDAAAQPVQFVGRTLLLDASMDDSNAFSSAFDALLKNARSPWATTGLTVRAVVYGDDAGVAARLESSPLLVALSAAHPVRVTVEIRGAAPGHASLSEMYTALRADVPAEPDAVVFAFVPDAALESPIAAWAEHWGGMCAGRSADDCVRAALEQPLASVCGLDDVFVTTHGRRISVGLSDFAAASDVFAINALLANAEEHARCAKLAADRLQSEAFLLRPHESVLEAIGDASTFSASPLPLSQLRSALHAAFGAQQRACAALRDPSMAPQEYHSLEQLMGVYVPILLPITLTVLVAAKSFFRDS